MAVKHTFASGRPDNADVGAVQPSHWNSDHTLTGLLALMDALSVSPNTVFTLDGANQPALTPISNFVQAASPAFTGVPTAPTASGGTNSTQIATTAFVQAAVAALIASAPGALDTLDELAAALGDDANFASTMTTLLAAKAPLASPALTGNPTAPNQTAGDNDTSIANTAFVQAAVNGLAKGQCRLSKSGSNLILLPLNGNLITVNGQRCTVPDAGVTLAPTSLTPGTLYYIYATQSGGAVSALEASTTGHSTDTTAGNKGVEIKTGDATRSLVGMAQIITGPAWVDTAAQRYVRSWFNRVKATMSASLAANRTTTSTSFTEINSEIRSQYLSWADETVAYTLNGFSFHSGSDYTVSAIAIDSTQRGGSAASFGTNGSQASVTTMVSGLGEGAHTATLFGKVKTSGTGTWLGDGTTVQTELYGVIL